MNEPSAEAEGSFMAEAEGTVGRTRALLPNPRAHK